MNEPQQSRPSVGCDALASRCEEFNARHGTDYTPETYAEARTRVPRLIAWDEGWEACDGAEASFAPAPWRLGNRPPSLPLTVIGVVKNKPVLVWYHSRTRCWHDNPAAFGSVPVEWWQYLPDCGMLKANVPALAQSGGEETKPKESNP